MVRFMCKVVCCSIVSYRNDLSDSSDEAGDVGKNPRGSRQARDLPRGSKGFELGIDLGGKDAKRKEAGKEPKEAKENGKEPRARSERRVEGIILGEARTTSDDQTSTCLSSDADGQGSSESGESAWFDPVDGQLDAATSQDWWQEAAVAEITCCQGLAMPGTVLGAHIHNHKQGDQPWLPGRSHDLYHQLGARQGHYIALWLKMGNNSLVFLSDLAAESAGMFKTRSGIDQRVKFVMNPVKIKVPLPCKGPKTASTVGSFFGSSSSSSLVTTNSGATVACVHIDLYSQMMLGMALKQVGFRFGNVIEVMLADWQGQAVLCAIRLQVSQTFLSLTA